MLQNSLIPLVHWSCRILILCLPATGLEDAPKGGLMTWWMCSHVAGGVEGLHGKETKGGTPNEPFFATGSVIGLLHIQHLLGCPLPSFYVRMASCERPQHASRNLGVLYFLLGNRENDCRTNYCLRACATSSKIAKQPVFPPGENQSVLIEGWSN